MQYEISYVVGGKEAVESEALVVQLLAESDVEALVIEFGKCWLLVGGGRRR